MAGENFMGFLAILGFDEVLFFDILKYTMMGIGVLVFISLLFVKAGYGRYTNKKWGPQIDNRWGWVLMECVPPILFFVFFLLGIDHTNITLVIFLLIWEIHYVQRAFVYPFLIRGKKQIPLAIVGLGLIFNGLNSYIQGRYLFYINPNYGAEWLTTPAFIIGTIIWLSGYIINLSSDRILRHLREPGETGYKIPHGGLFKYISCPNYFGEILEWAGWAILTWSFAGFVFALWTIANLAPRARSHHKWYQTHFPDYPPERRALIPFLI
ncbi:MAG: DUF1295 domain-containing protein [Promethearchaeota archaeon]